MSAPGQGKPWWLRAGYQNPSGVRRASVQEVPWYVLSEPKQGEGVSHAQEQS